TTLGGQAHAHIGRLNADGSVDQAFAASANDYVAVWSRNPTERFWSGDGLPNWVDSHAAISVVSRRMVGWMTHSIPHQTTSCTAWPFSPMGRFLSGASSAA